IFEYFYDIEVLTLVCVFTNKGAARNLAKGRKFSWTEHATIHGNQLPTGNIFSLHTPVAFMSRDQFLAILANVQMSDPEEGHQTEDPLHRVRPLMEMIGTRCRALCHPRQHLAVDERMVLTKARLSIKQYMKAKPTNYIVYTDNFYTSPVLFKHLRQQGFDTCGTYRQGRVGVPPPLNMPSPKSSIRWIRDGELLFVKWMDTREVSMCSTIHPVYAGDSVQCWQKSPDGKVQNVAVPRPTAVTEYNKYMGGVDTSDQIFGTHSIHRKTKRSSTTMFQHLVDIAVTNSFVIHKDQCVTMRRKQKTRQNFQEELAAHLLGIPFHDEPHKKPGEKLLPVPCSNEQAKSERASMGRRRCKLC
uniref:Si:dkey-19f4.2 n=1 Tax=Poecilia formosa TaxID=48698 RepID=A0A087YC72_POEFO